MDKTPNPDKDIEDDDTSQLNEDSIEKNFKTFRPYIETCVKVTDLIVFYDLFTAEQTKKFRQMFKTDSMGAIAMAFDEIEAMENQPDKYMQLLSAMKDAGYPKVERILKGLLLPVGSDHRKTIKKSAKDIYQNLITKEVLPHLLSRDVISPEDYEEISAIERHYSTGSAALDLINILPNRQRDWYRQFIESLVDSQHEELAKTIDEELVQKLKEKDIPRHYYASCQPASEAYIQTSCKSPRAVDKGRHYHAERRDYLRNPRHSLPKRYNSIIDYDDPYMMAREDFRPGAGHVENISLFIDSMKNKYIPRTWSREYTQFNPYSETDKNTENSSQIQCSPCKYGDLSIPAEYFCHDCTEYLCPECKIFHSRMKVLRTHHITGELPIQGDISPSTSGAEFSKKIFCGCDSKEVEIYCQTHEELVCPPCKIEKHGNCETCYINDVTTEILADKMQLANQIDESVQTLLETTLVERDTNLDYLMKTTLQCRDDISNYFDERLRHIMTEVDRFESEQRVKYKDQMEACSVSLMKLSSDRIQFEDSRKSKNNKEILASCQRLTATLKNIKIIFNNMSEDFDTRHIIFKSTDCSTDIGIHGNLMFISDAVKA